MVLRYKMLRKLCYYEAHDGKGCMTLAVFSSNFKSLSPVHVYKRAVSFSYSSWLLISLVFYGNLKAHKAWFHETRPSVREQKKEKNGNLGWAMNLIVSAQHAPKEAIDQSKTHWKKEKKNIDRIKPPSQSFKLQSSTFKLGAAAGMNLNYCAGGGFKVQRELTTVCLLHF